jgi:1,2-dihydroxy-3-keto-5-methylthiopentene dioxygenase
MKAYWYDNLPVCLPAPHSPHHPPLTLYQGDQREPHDSGREVSPAYLSKLGILSFNYPSESDVNSLAASRHYKNRDVITISPSTMGDAYEEKVKNFFHEHLHEDEEIRYILDGGGFFDVRAESDEWVRIKLEKWDLMIMPAGIYHRFTTDTENVSLKGKVGTGRRGIGDMRTNGGIVYQGDAPIPGGPEVDAVESGRGDGGESTSEGVSEDEGRGSCGGTLRLCGRDRMRT